MAHSKKDECPFGLRMQPYWDIRYELFSKFDEGVKLDKEGLYSAKPERSAQGIAKLIKGKTIVDAFGGLGGSSIAFSLSGKNVIYIENNPQRLEYAKHNAKIYKAQSNIEFILGDCLDLIPQLEFDSIYLDPPWVGEILFTSRDITPRCLNDRGIRLLKFVCAKKASIGFTVPNNFDYNQILTFEVDFFVKSDFIKRRMVYSTFFINSTKHVF